MTADPPITESRRRPRVAVIGGGFAGLNAVRELIGTPAEVVVVDGRNYHTFLPLLYQVATAGLNPADVAYPVRSIFRGADNVTFRHASAESVDPDGRTIALSDGHPLEYDYLVFAAGGRTTYFDIPGAEEHAFPLYTLADAVHLRNHMMSCFERAETYPEAVAEGALTFVIVGGGPTGVEMAGSMVELLRSVLFKDYPRIPRGTAKIVLIEMLPNLLSAFKDASQRHAVEALGKRGVDVRLGQQVESVEPGCVRFTSGDLLATRTVIWATGISASPLVRSLGVELERGGRVPVEPDLSLRGRPEIFVAGDAAAAKGPKGKPLPQLAPVAIQEGKHAARQIRRRIAGDDTRPFRYKNRGIMATIGRRAAVAELRGGISLSGSIAWVMWLLVHLVWLVGFRNRLSVLVNWVWNYIAWERGPRMVFDFTEGSRPTPDPARDERAGEGPKDAKAS